MDISWDDLRLFLDVARLGGLTPATRTTGLSAATLGRRVGALERQIGEPLFVRSQTGYRLTPAGEELLARSAEVEAAMLALSRWRRGERLVRVSTGWWTSWFLAQHIGEIWKPDEGIGIELVTANTKIDIGRRNADIGIRNARPVEQWLAGRLLGRTAYALYSARAPLNGTEGVFVGLAADAVVTPSARWLQAHHGDRIRVKGNDPTAVRQLIAAGAGHGVLPCFVGDADVSLMRSGPRIAELTAELWLVAHHTERHTPEVRMVAARIARLLRCHAPLFAGDTQRAGEGTSQRSSEASSLVPTASRAERSGPR
jgi:DNA-binding transcriptional LysR family regulator